jgi:Polysaccharide lyase family 4, domain II
LSSAAGYFWMRGYLFVDDHPYYARTDANGAFTLDAVPPGKYELVCWLANWHVAKQERDPETAFVSRIVFQPPVELSQSVLLQPTATVEATFAVSEELFAR